MCSKHVVFLTIVLCTSASIGFGQQSALATAKGLTFTASDLSPDGRQLYEQQAKLVAENRRAVFDQWIFEQLVVLEAKTRGIAIEKVRSEAVAKAAKPAEVQIKEVYEKNRQTIGNRTLDDVRPNIVQFLIREAAEKQLALLFDSLKAKYRFTVTKDVGLPLKASDIIATVGTRQIRVGEFEMANRIGLHNHRARINEDIRSDLESMIYARLLEAEARKRGIDPSGLIALEITNKLKDYSDQERIALEDAFQARLFRDYAVKIGMPEIEPQVLSISADDDPSIGPPDAKVTVVAFVDFQCSACAAFSPLMKQVVAEFGSNARLVVRDFPLTEIHDRSMEAALAGYAARQQGKFFEMGDLMYRNQDDLGMESLLKLARSLDIDAVRFERDVQSPFALDEVKKDIADGNAYGVNGTPAVFVNGVRLQRLSTARLRQSIQGALK